MKIQVENGKKAYYFACSDADQTQVVRTDVQAKIDSAKAQWIIRANKGPNPTGYTGGFR